MNELIGYVVAMSPVLETVVGVVRWLVTNAHPDDAELVYLVPIEEPKPGSSVGTIHAARYDVDVLPWGVARVGAGVWAYWPDLMKRAYVECRAPEEALDCHRMLAAMCGHGTLPSNEEYVPGADSGEFTAEEIALDAELYEGLAEGAYGAALEASERLSAVLEQEVAQ